jgi:hypothetical protein
VRGELTIIGGGRSLVGKNDSHNWMNGNKSTEGV